MVGLTTVATTSSTRSAGAQGSGISDGGTTARVFGTFLTWLSEKTAAVFVVATANDISQLPPELLRKGRLDEIFYVDLPSEEERTEIFRIHLAKRQRNPDGFDLPALVAASPDFSGAEIEEAIISALYDAFYEKQELTTVHVVAALEDPAAYEPGGRAVAINRELAVITDDLSRLTHEWEAATNSQS